MVSIDQTDVARVSLVCCLYDACCVKNYKKQKELQIEMDVLIFFLGDKNTRFQ